MDIIKTLIVDYQEGMEITQPCIIRNMPDEVYHSTIGLSASGMKLLLKCPAKYYYRYLSGEYKQKDKPHFKIGKACHKLILEGKEAFYDEYWHNPYRNFLKDDLIKNLQEKFGCTSTFKKLYVEEIMNLLFDYENIERKNIELDTNELNQIVSVARAIKENKYALNAFSQEGERELSIFWQDAATGIWLKCRPDFLPYDCQIVPDYKTCENAEPSIFYNSFIKYGYHIQAAQYRTGIRAVTGIDVDSFFFIAQEKEAPYITQPYLPEMALINHGDIAVRKAVDKYVECQNKGYWDTYSNRIIEMSLMPKPDDLAGLYDDANAVVYAPRWIDAELCRY